jgi:hypothetical protein
MPNPMIEHIKTSDSPVARQVRNWLAENRPELSIDKALSCSLARDTEDTGHTTKDVGNILGEEWEKHRALNTGTCTLVFFKGVWKQDEGTTLVAAQGGMEVLVIPISFPGD